MTKNYIQGMVSIVAPCYNHALFVDDFLDSIVAQSYSNIELIVCDDCSSDDSYIKLIRRENELKKKLRNVILLKNEENIGCCKTLNRMITLAQGEYIKPFSADDMLAPEYISSVIGYFGRNNNADVIVTNGIRSAENSTYNSIIPLGVIYDKPPNFFSEDLFRRLYYENDVFSPGMIIRATVFEDVGLYNEKGMIDDWDLVLRIARRNYSFRFIDKKYVYYRISANSITSKAENHLLEGRRLSIFEAELKTIDNYGGEFSHYEYMKRRIHYIFRMKRYASIHHMALLIEKTTYELRQTYVMLSFTEVLWYRTTQMKQILIYCKEKIGYVLNGDS